MIKTNFNKFLFHISKIKNYFFKFNIILISIFFLINSTSPFVYFFEIHKIGSFSNIADNWINYLFISFIIFNSIILIINKKLLIIPYYFFFILFYLFCLFISALLADNFNFYVMWEITSFAVGTLFFLSLYQNSFSNKNINLFFWVLFFSGFTNSLISYCQIYSIQIFDISFEINNFPSGGFFQTNKLASFLATTLLCTLCIKKKSYTEYIYKNNINFISIILKKYRIYYLMIIVMLSSIFKLFILKSTNSLTGLIGFLFGLFILTIWRHKKRNYKSQYLIPIIPFILLTIFILFHEDIKHFFLHEANASTKILNKINSSSFDIRKNLYIACFEIFKEKPIFGYGLGTFKEIFQSKRVFVNYGKVPSDKIWLHPHNEFLYRLIESGTLGGLGIISLALSFIIIVILKNRIDALKYFALIFPLTFHLQTETPFHHNEISWFLFLLILYISMKKNYFTIKLSAVFNSYKIFIFIFLFIIQLSLTYWLVDKAFLSKNASKAFYLINSKTSYGNLYNLLQSHLNDSYYRPLAQYILLLHNRRYWLKITENKKLLTEFVEETEKNHLWLPSKNLPLLKAIALAKLNRLDEAKNELNKSSFRFPNNKRNLEDVSRAIDYYEKKYLNLKSTPLTN